MWVWVWVQLTPPGLHVVHIAVEMAPICKVGGLGDVVTALGRAVQEQGHMVEVILPRCALIMLPPSSDLWILTVLAWDYMLLCRVGTQYAHFMFGHPHVCCKLIHRAFLTCTTN